MTDIFCELLSVKEPQTTLQNKETTVPCYRKMSDQNTKKSPGIELSGSLYRSSIHRLTDEPPSPSHTSQYAFNWTMEI